MGATIVVFSIVFLVLAAGARWGWKLAFSPSRLKYGVLTYFRWMARIFGFLLLIACVGAGTRLGYSFYLTTFGSLRPDVYRYRLTLNVSYNDKLYSGSSVIEARQHRHVGLSSAGNYGVGTRFDSKGTSPIVKLGENGGWIFASVGAGSQIEYLPWRAYFGKIHHADERGKILRLPPDPPR